MDPTTITILEGACILLCLVGIAFFSLSEASLVATNKIRLRRVLDEEEPDGDTGEAVERMSRESQQLLATVIVGINIPVLLASALTTHLTRRAYPHHDYLVELVSLCMIATILVFCEILPKSYGVQRAEQVALRVARAMGVVMVALHYPTRAVMGLSGVLIRLLGGSQPEPAESVTEEDLKELVEVGQEEGVLEEEERRLFHSVFEFGETVTRAVMSPRTDMVCLPREATVQQALQTMAESGHSRIPVYDKHIDSILGVVYLNDLLALSVSGCTGIRPVDHLREPLFVPETKKIDELFRELQEQQVHIAMVVDEHGGIAGLLTMEDLLEEIFGEIRDEHDSEEEALIVERPDGSYVVDGRATVNEVAEALHVSLPDGEFDTLAGFLADLAGRLPETGEVFEAPCGRFEVLEVEDRRTRKVRVHPSRDAEGADATRERG
jgi:putative hemolysin